ncbi:hypothetical protein STEG23_025738 [Scotinomys teguina]
MKWNRELRQLQIEDLEAQILLMPLFRQRWTRETLQILQENLEEKAVIMKVVPDWKMDESVFHTTLWMQSLPGKLYQLRSKDELDNTNFSFIWYT